MKDGVSKVCTGCNVKKGFSEYHKQKSGKLGLRSTCKQCRVSSRHIYYINNREKQQKQTKEWQQQNKKFFKHICKKWKTENKSKVISYGAKRRATKLKATPPWTTPEMEKEMKLFYKYSAELSVATEIKWNVDHIIPLLGENVCGLHIPINLQIITKEDNLMKGNKLEEIL